MITLQHALVTLVGLRGNEEELKTEIQYVYDGKGIRKVIIPYIEYLKMYKKVIKEMIKIDYEKNIENDILKSGKNLERKYKEQKDLSEDHE